MKTSQTLRLVSSLLFMGIVVVRCSYSNGWKLPLSDSTAHLSFFSGLNASGSGTLNPLERIVIRMNNVQRVSVTWRRINVARRTDIFATKMTTVAVRKWCVLDRSLMYADPRMRNLDSGHLGSSVTDVNMQLFLTYTCAYGKTFVR